MAATMRIYSCGGAATNICKEFEAFRGVEDAGFTIIDTVYVDTSASNLNFEHPEEAVYLVDGVDGSGKKRSMNHSQIAERVNEILFLFKPTDINIVIHSTSGGSGSVLGPSLVSELLDRNMPTIVLMAASTDSGIETENTLKTIKTYESISKLRNKPVVASYYENAKMGGRKNVDTTIHKSVVLLAALFSKENVEMDTADLANWLNFVQVTSFKPQLAFLDFFSETIEVEKGQDLISLATLSIEGIDTTPNVHVEYQTTGFLSDEASQKVASDLPIHYAIINGHFHAVVDELNKKVKAANELKAARVERSLLAGHETATDSGIIL